MSKFRASNAYYLERYHRIRKEAIEILGGKCVCCGSTENLQIDHIDPKEKTLKVAKEYANPLFWEELKKCQLLCQSCHIKKTSEEQRKNIHGTWGMHKRGCRCEKCKALVANYSREYKRKKREQKN